MSDVLDFPPDDADTTESNELENAQPNRELADQLKRWIEAPNIAADLSDDECSKIAQRVLRDYEIDEESRAEWKDKYDKWLKIAMQMSEAKTYPWPGASSIIYPLMTTAAIQFAARAYPAIIRDKDVVKGAIEGPDDGIPRTDPQTHQPLTQPGPDGQPQPVWLVPPGEKKMRADKIGQHMSWQLLEEQEEWEPQTDRLLTILPIVGCVFRKSYFDPGMQRNVSEMVTALQLCVNYKAKSFETAPRVSEILELYPWEIEEKIRAGVYLDENYGADQDAGMDEDAAVTFIEQHRRWDLDGDGYAEPYIITVAKDSMRMARIRAAYDEDGVFFSAKDHRVRKIEPIKYYTKYGFIPSTDSNVYDIGFGNLLYPINEAINSTLNQMFDAGHLANTAGGFIGSGLSMNAGAVRFQVGEFKQVNATGGLIRDNIYQMQWPGPNPVLLELLQFLVEAGKEVAAVKDVMVGDLPGDNTSGVATLAMIEQGLKVFSAIYKRIHRSLKQEFKKLFRLNRRYLPRQSGYQRGNEWHEITQADYEAGAGVEPVSDPQMVTDMQKLGRAQFLLQNFKEDPWFKARDLRVNVLDALLIPNGDELLLPALPPNPVLGLKVAEMQLKKEDLNLRETDARVKASHEEADLAIRRGKDKAAELETLSHAILNLAQAAQADHEVNQGWYAQHLAAVKLQVDALNAGTDDGPSSINPADIAGLVAPGGPNGPAVPSMAPPPGQPPGAPVPGGPGGPSGPGDAAPLGGGGP